MQVFLFNSCFSILAFSGATIQIYLDYCILEHKIPNSFRSLHSRAWNSEFIFIIAFSGVDSRIHLDSCILGCRLANSIRLVHSQASNSEFIMKRKLINTAILKRLPISRSTEELHPAFLKMIIWKVFNANLMKRKLIKSCGSSCSLEKNNLEDVQCRSQEA